MALNAGADLMSLAEASKLGVSALVREVEAGREQVILRNDKPVAVIMSVEQFDRLQQLQEDLADLAHAASRMATAGTHPHALNEVLQRLGYAREDRADAPEPQSLGPIAKSRTTVQRRFRSIDPATHPLIGRWRIVEMEMWDRDYIDLVEPGYIEFGAHGQGEFAFGVVTASLDLWYAPSSIDFTWRGSDEGDEVFGDGSAELDDEGILIGEIRFHYGDESGFKAQRW